MQSQVESSDSSPQIRNCARVLSSLKSHSPYRSFAKSFLKILTSVNCTQTTWCPADLLDLVWDPEPRMLLVEASFVREQVPFCGEGGADLACKACGKSPWEMLSTAKGTEPCSRSPRVPLSKVDENSIHCRIRLPYASGWLADCLHCAHGRGLPLSLWASSSQLTLSQEKSKRSSPLL